jgi:chaperonin GroES
MLQPLHDRVLVKLIPWNETSAGGVVIPAHDVEGESQHGSMRGRVLALGPGRQGTSDDGKSYYHAPICPRRDKDDDARTGAHVDGIKVGDEVVFGAYAGCPVRVQGEECRLVAAHDIFAVEMP